MFPDIFVVVISRGGGGGVDWASGRSANAAEPRGTVRAPRETRVARSMILTGPDAIQQFLRSSGRERTNEVYWTVQFFCPGYFFGDNEITVLPPSSRARGRRFRRGSDFPVPSRVFTASRGSQQPDRRTSPSGPPSVRNSFQTRRIPGTRLEPLRFETKERSSGNSFCSRETRTKMFYFFYLNGKSLCW